jgi:hypothetical protein
LALRIGLLSPISTRPRIEKQHCSRPTARLPPGKSGSTAAPPDMD